jgi:preprotein translocase subunit SecE
VNKYILGLLTASAAFVKAQAPALTNAVTNAVTNAAAATTGAVANAAATVATNPVTTAARTTASKEGGGYLPLLIWGAIIAAVFFFLWSKGYLIKIRNYVEETKEELQKCSWPSRDELKGSTVVVMVTIAILGVFTVGVDWVLSNLMRLIT